MDNFFKTELQDLLKKDLRIIVPEYQRTFIWGKDEANNLITDINDSDSGSFLGTVVFHSTGKQEIRVVDGQQRLTSIFILLSALRRQAKKIGNQKLAQRIHEKISYIDESTGQDKDPKIEVSPIIKDVFDETIAVYDWDGDFNLKEFKNKKSIVKKIKPIYDEFWSFVKDLKEKELSDFLSKTYSCYFGEIVIRDITNAFEIFERMNSRGVELNAADLLKNHLFSELYEEDFSVEEIWERISEVSGLLRMLRYYYISRGGHVSYKKLFSELKSLSHEIGAKTVLFDLEKFSKIYSVISNPTIESLKEVFIDDLKVEEFSNKNRLDSLLRTLSSFSLFGVTQAYPLIMSLTHSLLEDTKRNDSDVKKYIGTLEKLEKFLFINHEVIGNPGNMIEKDFADLSKTVYQKGSFVEDCELIEKYIRKNIEDKEQFILSFNQITYESSTLKSIYYIFDRITNYKQKGSEIIDVYNIDQRITRGNFNIEHLLPQSKITDENRDYVHSIGNLIVISLHTNSRLHDLPFSKKIEILQKRQNKLNIVKDFIKENKDKKDWSLKDIEKRTNDLAKISYDQIWKI